ncbi:tyrosine-type recombinase/integrase [Streptomyces sp. NPDC001282]|uniref:tyrosine-type recombinase/integrase n=1 Tax=Streptomyces sp. NPDC001282 TaxID=3364557 RepID=UPI0036AD87EC
MARRAANNPRQKPSKLCGCAPCKSRYPEAQYGDRKSRRDCIGSWQARYRDTDGTQKAKNFPKKSEADAFLDSIRTSVRQGTYLDSKRGDILIADWWDLWWPAHKKGRTTTRNRKLASWKHINGKWGRRKLNSLTHMELQAWVTAEIKGHATQKKVLELLNMMLRDAVRDQRIPFNPGEHVQVTASPPARHPDDLKPPTREQYALIRQNLPEYYRPLAVFLEETGMRWGEATALRRCHVDLDTDIVKVREVVIDDDGRLMRQAAPKTAAGFRVVPLTPAAVGAVQTMIEKWNPAETESPIESGMHPEELIFRSPRSGEKRRVRNEAGEPVEVTVEGVLNRNNFKRVWLPAIKDAGIARLVKNQETGRNEWWPRVHDYRHALATRLHAAGVSEKDVQLVLGQKRGGRVTWLYTHGSDAALVTVKNAMMGRTARRLHAVS